MTKQSNPKSVKLKGEQANRLLADPLFNEACDVLKRAYTDRMIGTKIDEIQQRDHWHRCIIALEDVKTALTTFVQAGKIETLQAEKKERAKK